MVATNEPYDEADPSPVRLQYLKRRKVLRLWSTERASEPIEVPRTALLQALGDDPADTEGSAARYLLIAGVPGRSDGAGELRPVVATFEYEDQARGAFRALRLRGHPRTAWAQIVSIDAKGRPRPICWFGTSPSSSPNSQSRGPVPTRRDGAQDYGAKPAVRRWRTWPRGRRQFRALTPAPDPFSQTAVL